MHADEDEPWKLFHEMTDEQWEGLEELLPEKMHGERARFNGILWVFTTRNRWRDMPEKFGKYNTARNRAQRLRDQGFWHMFMEQAKEFGFARTKGEFFAQQRRR